MHSRLATKGRHSFGCLLALPSLDFPSDLLQPVGPALHDIASTTHGVDASGSVDGSLTSRSDRRTWTVSQIHRQRQIRAIGRPTKVKAIAVEIPSARFPGLADCSTERSRKVRIIATTTSSGLMMAATSPITNVAERTLRNFCTLQPLSVDVTFGER